jgi:hypothetical protein
MEHSPTYFKLVVLQQEILRMIDTPIAYARGRISLGPLKSYDSGISSRQG